ncbi:DUF502 domain-containing protein [Portibacter marinus]|uniref:DUF502 domain-containing protein n=1 Tax=Portibacter marinus TaxID=2898660 RepID=UPI001F3AE3A0|nr:DUF502 domain-containing protein [Portibacter marinus]
MFARLLSYFISGLALVLPLLLTAWVIFYILSYVDSYLKLRSSMLIFLGVIVLLTLIGYLARKYVEVAFWARVEAYLIKLPILGLVYKSVKDITTALIGRDRKFSEPVMVKMHDEDVYKIGFITNKEVGLLLGEQTDQSTEDKFFLVYFPLSFSLSGDLYLVPRSRVRPIQGKAKDVMQAIVSGGIINVDGPKKIIH